MPGLGASAARASTPCSTSSRERLSGVLTEATITIAADKHAVISWAYENAVVNGREDHEDGSVSLDVRLTDRQARSSWSASSAAEGDDKEDWER
ncbi:MAG: hypothetical protein U5N27_15870 [Rhizobium sp.]|nr:hypothetical protein [Rhizobium sp.]